MISRIKNIIRKIITNLAPVCKRKVVFCNYGGRGVGDNPGAIAIEMLREGVKADLVWLVSDIGTPVPKGIRKVKIKGIKFFWTYITAKILISNTKYHFPFRKNKETVYIQTWHGDMPFKKIEGECEDSLSSGYLRATKADSAQTDYILSGSEFFSAIARKYFWLPSECKILEYGIPRDDYLYNVTEKEKQLAKIEICGSSDVNVISYAPTFRDDNSTACYNIDVERVVAALERKTSSKWVMVIRLHPCAEKFVNIFKYNDHIINGTNLPDQGKLWAISDMLISDYSSTVREFILMKRPVFLYIPDIDQYALNNRPLRDLYYKLPFDRCVTNEELVLAIQNLNISKYKAQVAEFVNKEFKHIYDGRASKRVVGLIRQIIKS